MRLGFLAAVGLTGALTNCAVVDKFSERAIDFNTEVEKTQSTGLLLNVMRAAHRQPMQFIDLTTVTGLASLQGGAAAGLPLGGVRGTGSQLFTLAPTFSISGGPSFTMSALNTQDFYKGILSPISIQLFDWYTKAGLPGEMLFSLFVNEINFARSPAEPARNDFQLDPATKGKLNYDRFARTLHGLVELGITTDSASQVDDVGAPLLYQSVGELKANKDLDALQLKLVVRKICTAAEVAVKGKCEDRLTEEQRKQFSGQTHYYQLTKSSKRYEICFNRTPLSARTDLSWLNLSDAEKNYIAKLPVHEIKAKIIAEKAFCGPPPRDKEPAPKVASNGMRSFQITLRSPDADTAAGSLDASDIVNVSLNLRSAEQIIYYLGQIARYQLGLGRFAGIKVEEKIGKCEKALQIPISIDGQTCASLFTVSRETRSPAISFDYLGSTYYVPISSTGEDRSGQVMEIATQILNVNKSAKDFPAPSVIPVVQ